MTIDQHTFNRLIADNISMESLLSKYNYIGITPFGLLDKVNRHFSNNSELYYNSYFVNSLLRNNNKWLDLNSLKDFYFF